MTLEIWTSFFGWMTVINFVLLALIGIMLTVFRAPIANIHNRLTGLSNEDLHRAYFAYLANYKVLVIVTSVVPYLALKMM